MLIQNKFVNKEKTDGSYRKKWNEEGINSDNGNSQRVGHLDMCQPPLKFNKKRVSKNDNQEY